MTEGVLAGLFTTYINLPPNLHKPILGENTVRFFAVPPWQDSSEWQEGKIV